MNKSKALFLSASSSGMLLKGLYQQIKSENKKFSLQYIANKAGLPSKGYLGDVFSGRRKLNIKHAPEVAALFGLKGSEKKIFLLLLEIENASSGLRAKVLKKRLQSVQAQLKGDSPGLSSSLESQMLLTRVFCSLGVFSAPPSRDQIKSFFKEIPSETIETVLNDLIRQKLIEEKEGLLKFLSNEFVFDINSDASGNADNHLRYLQVSMEHAKNQVPVWKSDRIQSYFESSILSIKFKNLAPAILRIRDFFDLIQTELEESQDADDLAYFNVQIFPERGGK